MGLCASKPATTEVQEVKDNQTTNEGPNKKMGSKKNSLRRLSLNLTKDTYTKAENEVRRTMSEALGIPPAVEGEDPVALRKKLVAEALKKKVEFKPGGSDNASSLILQDPMKKSDMTYEGAKDGKISTKREARRVSRIVDPNAPRATHVFGTRKSDRKPIYGISLAKTPFQIKSCGVHQRQDKDDENNGSSDFRLSVYGVLLPGSDSTGEHAHECEDNLFIDDDFRKKADILGLVFDGHGHQGAMAAMYCEKRFGELLTNEFAADLDRGDIKEAFDKVFKEVDEGLQQSWRMILSGTTATTLYVKGKKATISSCGNSAAYLFRAVGEKEMEAVCMTTEHTLEDENERKRCIAAGASVRVNDGIYRVYEADGFTPGLSLSRTLGDIKAHELGVTSKPDHREHEISKEDRFIVVATDGLWQVLSHVDVCEFLNEHRDLNVDALTRILVEKTQKIWSQKSEALNLVIDDTAIIILKIQS